MTKIVLLDLFPADQGQPEAWSQLHQLGEVVRYDRTPRDHVLERCREARAVITNKVPFQRGDFEALNALQYVGVAATGFNIIDVDAAREHGVAVTNVPGYSTASVAQATLALLLEITNAVSAHDRRVHASDWAGNPDFCFLAQPISELADKTLLIIGAGAIGSQVGRVAEALGMRVVAGQVPGRPARPDRIPLAEALPSADVISIHCPLTPRTQHLVNGDFLSQCKRNVILLNTARGQIIDDEALVAWLDDHPDARVGVDVLSAEPPATDHPFLGHAQITITPHVAWASREARRRLRDEIIANLSAWQAGRRRNRVV